MLPKPATAQGCVRTVCFPAELSTQIPEDLWAGTTPSFSQACSLVTALLTAVSLHPSHPTSSDSRLHGKMTDQLAETTEGKECNADAHSLHCRDLERDP